MDDNLGDLGNLFLALSDMTRLRLIALMADGPVAVGFLAESIGESQPKVSRHLAYLRNAGLVSTRREGKNVYYGIETPTDPTSRGVLDLITGPRQMVEVSESKTIADISDKTYVNDYVSQEIDIHLL